MAHWIDNPNPEIYLSGNYLVVDFENTIYEDDGSALNPNNSLLLAVTQTPIGDTSVIWGNEFGMEALIKRIKDVDFIVCHNAKHELQWLRRAGMALEDVLVYDTMVGEYVLAGNRSIALSLAETSKRYGFGSKDKFIDLCMKAGMCPSNYPKELLERRCIKDVEQTHNVFKVQREKLVENDQLKTQFTRCIFTPVLADIEFNGLHLDSERVQAAFTEHAERHRKIGAELASFCGDINLNSGPQKAELLYERFGFDELKDRRGNELRTPAGRPLTDSGTIAKLKATTKEQKKFVKLWKDYNKSTSYLSKNLEFFMGVVEEYGFIFQGQFNQCVTVTHRLSSSGRRMFFNMWDRKKSVQFQNLPREFKKLFTPRNKTWDIAEIDAGQLEFRVAAQLSGDKQAIADIESGADVHTYTASIIYNIPEDDVTSKQRTEAKPHTFKPMYGGKSGTPREIKYYEAFKRKYAGITAWQDANTYSTLASKQLKIPSGLVFYWPDIAVVGKSYITHSSEICNYPIQSLATADMIPIAVTKLWHDMKASKLDSFLINTVHDSAIAELSPEEHEIFKDISSYAFTEYVYSYLKEVYDYEFVVPLASEITIGSHWSEGKSSVHNSISPFIGGNK